MTKGREGTLAIGGTRNIALSHRERQRVCSHRPCSSTPLLGAFFFIRHERKRNNISSSPRGKSNRLIANLIVSRSIGSSISRQKFEMRKNRISVSHENAIQIYNIKNSCKITTIIINNFGTNCYECKYTHTIIFPSCK